MKNSQPAVLIVLMFLLAAGGGGLLAGKERARLESAWRTSPVIVDGSPADWPGPLQRFNDLPLSMAAVNDGDDLILALTVSDPAVRRQILRRGLIVWFDSAGKDKKRFGVKFPVGTRLTDADLRALDGDTSRAPNGNPRQGMAGRAQPPAGDLTIEPTNRLEVLGPEKDDARSFTADQAPGILVKVGQAEALLTYELQVPLAVSDAHRYAIGAKAGAGIGVGLEMPKMEAPAGREGRGRGGASGGGMGAPGGGGRPGGMGGMGGGRGPSPQEGSPGQAQPKPLAGWVTLQLAAPAR